MGGGEGEGKSERAGKRGSEKTRRRKWREGGKRRDLVFAIPPDEAKANPNQYL